MRGAPLLNVNKEPNIGNALVCSCLSSVLCRAAQNDLILFVCKFMSSHPTSVRIIKEIRIGCCWDMHSRFGRPYFWMPYRGKYSVVRSDGPTPRDRIAIRPQQGQAFSLEAALQSGKLQLRSYVQCSGTKLAHHTDEEEIAAFKQSFGTDPSSAGSRGARRVTETHKFAAIVGL